MVLGIFKTVLHLQDWQDFHTKRTCQKPILRQIEWEVQIGCIT